MKIHPGPGPDAVHGEPDLIPLIASPRRKGISPQIASRETNHGFACQFAPIQVKTRFGEA
jgi:hypothetical protein